VDLEQTHVGRIAKRGGDGTRARLLLCPDDEAVLLECKPNVGARRRMIVGNQDAWGTGI
jgi:hypothetical protein